MNDMLAPASVETVASRLLSLKGSGLEFPPGIDPQRAGEIYAFAMRGVSGEGLKRACIRIIQGDVADIGFQFIPTPPRLAVLARAETDVIRRDRERIVLALESMAPQRGPEPSEESKARVRAMVERVRRRMDVTPKEDGRND